MNANKKHGICALLTVLLILAGMAAILAVLLRTRKEVCAFIRDVEKKLNVSRSPFVVEL